MIDTHSHVFLPQFSGDLASVEERAKQEGVSRILLPNVDSGTIEALRKTLQRDRDLYGAMMGLHPCSVKEGWEDELSRIHDELLANRADYLAIGEIGLDLYWEKDTLEMQQSALRTQFNWAIRENLPVSIHCREAFDPLFEVLEEFVGKGLNGVLHCFTGDRKQAERCLTLGLHLGIGGVVTFKNGGLDHALPGLPIAKMVLETDAPYLAPKPYRGKRNEPSYLKFIAARLAEVMGLSPEDVISQTSRNAVKLYGI